MNISTGLALPQKEVSPCEEFSSMGLAKIRRASSTVRKSVPSTFLLGLYSYDSHKNTHDGDLLKVQIERNDSYPSFKVEKISAGTGVFFMMLVLRPRQERENFFVFLQWESYFLTCCTDGSIRIYSVNTMNGNDAIRECSRLCRSIIGDKEHSKSPVMCTSCDLCSLEKVQFQEKRKDFSLRRYAQKFKTNMSRLFSRNAETCDAMWVPASSTRILRTQSGNIPGCTRTMLVASYSDGRCCVFGASEPDWPDFKIIHDFQAHSSETWCVRIHRYLLDRSELVFSTGADDGSWKIWRYDEHCPESHVQLVSKVQLEVGVVCICPVFQSALEFSGDSTTANQKVLVGCYDENVRLYAFSSSYVPELICAVNVGGGPWRISQEVPLIGKDKSTTSWVSPSCDCMESSLDAKECPYNFLVSCMYSGHCVLHYHPKNGLWVCTSQRQLHSKSHNLFTDGPLDEESPELTYFAEWLPPNRNSRFTQTNNLRSRRKTDFVTASYYHRRLQLYYQ